MEATLLEIASRKCGFTK